MLKQDVVSIITVIFVITSLWAEAVAHNGMVSAHPLTELSVSGALQPAPIQTRARSSAEGVRSPGETLRAARTLYIEPSLRIDRKYVQYKLLKTDQLAEWGITLVEDARGADLLLRLDQVRLNYLFTILDPSTSAVIVSGKVVAINDPVAADLLGREIIKRMREVRRTADVRPPRRSEGDGKEDDN